MRFVLTDDSVDRDYERILVSGLKTENFEKNPVMLYQHRYDSFWSGKEAPLPIGYWSDLKKEGNKITAEPVFNDTELAQQVKSLVEHGTLNACSIGFRAVSYSNSPELMLPGQKYATITESELLEASIVMIPANPNATVVKSFDSNGKKYQLSGSSKATTAQIESLTKAAENFHPKSTFDMTKKFAELQKSVTDGFAKIMKALAEGMKNADEQPETKEANEQKVKEIETMVEEIQTNVKKLQDENETLEKANTKFDTDLKAANSTISKQATEIAELKEKLLNRSEENPELNAGGGEGGKDKKETLSARLKRYRGE